MITLAKRDAKKFLKALESKPLAHRILEYLGIRNEFSEPMRRAVRFRPGVPEYDSRLL